MKKTVKLPQLATQLFPFQSCTSFPNIYYFLFFMNYSSLGGYKVIFHSALGLRFSNDIMTYVL